MNVFKRLRLSFVITLLLGYSIQSHAGYVDTVNVQGKLSHQNAKAVVILPDTYKKGMEKFPVVYLLHGYSGDYANWIKRVPQLKTYVDKYQLIIVCPDGGYSSWYLNSPINPNSQYETFIGKDVPQFIDSAYRTIQNTKGRAICGLSMGGHGALYIAMQHPEFFGAASSMSGVLDLSPYKTKLGLPQLLGDTLGYNIQFPAHSVVNMAQQALIDSLQVMVDCGVDDPFIETNRRLHQTLLQRKKAHTYLEREGGHSWNYWQNAIEFHLLFFRRYFDQNSN